MFGCFELSVENIILYDKLNLLAAKVKPFGLQIVVNNRCIFILFK